ACFHSVPFLLLLPPPLRPALVPYTTLFRSLARLRTRAVTIFDSADFLLTPAIDGPVIRWEDIMTDSAAKFMHYSMPFNVLGWPRSEEHTSELQSRFDLVCRLLLEKQNSRQI